MVTSTQGSRHVPAMVAARGRRYPRPGYSNPPGVARALPVRKPEDDWMCLALRVPLAWFQAGLVSGGSYLRLVSLALACLSPSSLSPVWSPVGPLRKSYICNIHVELGTRQACCKHNIYPTIMWTPELDANVAFTRNTQHKMPHIWGIVDNRVAYFKKIQNSCRAWEST